MKGRKQLFSNVKTEPNAKDFWETPRWVFWFFDYIFKFECDLAASHENHLCDKYFTEENDALKQDWTGKCFLNPPYSITGKFAQKAIEELERNKAAGTHLSIHLLIPSRTCTKYFHKLRGHVNDLNFIEGRLKFLINGIPAAHAAPFPSVVLHLTTDKIDRPDAALVYSLKKDKLGVERVIW